MFYYWVIAFLGIIIGLILASRTKEELKIGKKYFILLGRLVFFTLIVFLLYKVSFNFLIILFFILGIFFSFKLNKVYFYLGLTLLLSSFISESFLIAITSLIFIFGLVYGTLIYSRKKINISFDLIYFLIPLILLFVKGFVVNNIEIFLSFVAGTLFFNFIKKIR
jgi:hypothetical protein